MRSHSLIGAWVAALAMSVDSFRMTDGEPSSSEPQGEQDQTGAAQDVAPGPGDTFQADEPAHTGVIVPDEHVDLLQRAVELLKSGEQWVIDNIEAGITTLENMLNGDNSQGGTPQ